MAKATMTFEDTEDGGVTIELVFDPPLDDSLASTKAKSLASRLLRAMVELRESTDEYSAEQRHRRQQQPQDLPEKGPMNQLISPVQQPCELSCLPACVAMVIGQPLELILPHFPQLPAYELDAMKCLVRFGYLPIERPSHSIYEGGVFIVTVPSLNRVGQLHAVVVETRGPESYRVLDPQAGRGGAFYTADEPLPVCGLIEVMHAYEVAN